MKILHNMQKQLLLLSTYLIFYLSKKVKGEVKSCKGSFTLLHLCVFAASRQRRGCSVSYILIVCILGAVPQEKADWLLGEVCLIVYKETV